MNAPNFAENMLLKLIAELAARNHSEPLKIEVLAGNRRCVLSVDCVRNNAELEPGNEIERDILDWFRSQPTGPGKLALEISEGLAVAGFRYGPATVKAALSRLVRLGFLENKRNRSGYRLRFG